MKKFFYYFLLTVTVLAVAMAAGYAVWCWAYDQFFYVPPTGSILPESAGANAGSGLSLLAAAFAGGLGGAFLYFLEDGGPRDHTGGGDE